MALAERRHKLVEAALAVIGRGGVGAATTRAIAAQAEMPLASFHYAFESHQALMVEAMRTLADEVLAEGALPELHGRSRQQVLQELLDWHLADLARRPTTYLTMVELGDYALRTEGQQGVVAAWRRRRVERLMGAFGVNGSHGLDEDFAELVLTVIDGLTQLWLGTHDEQLARRTAATMVALAGPATERQQSVA